MSEVLLLGENSPVYAEHLTKRNVAGSLESVTEKLTLALEQLGYSVVGSGPIVAKRQPNSERVGKIFNVPIRLTVTLRPATENVFTATFEYHMIYAGVYKGDLKTVEREVDAIVALAFQRSDSGICPVCGTNNQADSRFCRVCGTPAAGRVPAELEILRLNAELRTGHRAVIGGISTILIASAIAAAFILWGNPKGVNVGCGLLAIGHLIGWLVTLWGIYVNHLALNPRSKRSANDSDAAQFAAPAERAELSAPAAFTSVTENTTRSLSMADADMLPEHRRSGFDTMEH